MGLQVVIPGARTSPPASENQLQEVEQILGVRLPPQLRALYLECDGFREPKGNAKYLLSLTEEDTIGSLVSTTKFWWHEWRTISAPELQIDFSPYLFFGSSSADEAWAIALTGPPKIIGYHHHMGGEFETLGTDILEVFRTDFARYDDLAQ
ncbi:SMI1/KNR4 family protein [Terricaulis sp.]|uniref:SMI1/KNR4 family protein n=1 Tax=Terricaulis sp. TaxID=2768686 RepID=UPI002AC55ED1|nr:SMI1/KNR4 family protein [Terricaulis sp.]MDZ4692258.1 SMI1/KNR4 family protein [Terricaulis sp.]